MLKYGLSSAPSDATDGADAVVAHFLHKQHELSTLMTRINTAT